MYISVYYLDHIHMYIYVSVVVKLNNLECLLLVKYSYSVGSGYYLGNYTIKQNPKLFWVHMVPRIILFKKKGNISLSTNYLGLETKEVRIFWFSLNTHSGYFLCNWSNKNSSCCNLGFMAWISLAPSYDLKLLVIHIYEV